MRWGWLVRSLRASVTWMEAARLTAVERMPAVSQVSTGPVGGLGKMQARQAVGGQREEAIGDSSTDSSTSRLAKRCELLRSVCSG